MLSWKQLLTISGHWQDQFRRLKLEGGGGSPGAVFSQTASVHEMLMECSVLQVQDFQQLLMVGGGQQDQIKGLKAGVGGSVEGFT